MLGLCNKMKFNNIIINIFDQIPLYRYLDNADWTTIGTLQKRFIKFHNIFQYFQLINICVLWYKDMQIYVIHIFVLTIKTKFSTNMENFAIIIPHVC